MNRETSPTEDEIRAYYAARAPEYDRIYQKPERQDDLRELVAYLPSLFVGRRVLDIACGTGFWYSHIPVNRRHEFFVNLAKRLSPGATVALLDNRYVEGSIHPITDCDEQGNTYQSRKLDDGSEH